MSKHEIKFGTTDLNWYDINDLFIRAPLGERPPEMFKEACEKSGVVVSVYTEGKLIGFGRALTDFVAYAAIYDVVVLPEYQGQGIGSKIIEAILEKIPKCWVITLFAEPGREQFYERLDFKKMHTAMAKFKNVSGAVAKGFI